MNNTINLGKITYSCGHTETIPAEIVKDIPWMIKSYECPKCHETKENTMDDKNLTDDQIKAIWKNFKKEYKAETGWSGVAYMNAAQLAKRTATITIYYTCKKETAQDRSKAHNVYEKRMATESVKNVLRALNATATFEYRGSGYQYGGPVAKIRLSF